MGLRTVEDVTACRKNEIVRDLCTMAELITTTAEFNRRSAPFSRSDMRSVFDCVSVPSITSWQFIRQVSHEIRMNDYAKALGEDYWYTAFYLMDSLCNKGRMPLTPTNLHRVVLISVLAAVKELLQVTDPHVCESCCSGSECSSSSSVAKSVEEVAELPFRRLVSDVAAAGGVTDLDLSQMYSAFLQLLGPSAARRATFVTERVARKLTRHKPQCKRLYHDETSGRTWGCLLPPSSKRLPPCVPPTSTLLSQASAHTHHQLSPHQPPCQPPTASLRSRDSDLPPLSHGLKSRSSITSTPPVTPSVTTTTTTTSEARDPQSSTYLRRKLDLARIFADTNLPARESEPLSS
ncbi:hypothetical protein DIPPA_33452 [Diplonema papillatum]|nr:hypothetical protein DIPPA_33452 [Diplonema papillatum]|eukprot:gene17747-27321_t